MRKFTRGKNADRFNNIIDDVSLLKTQPKKRAYSGNYGIVRCFLLTDTSTTPMIATGLKWDSATSDWVTSGLGDAVLVYPHPDKANSDYTDNTHVFCRNFGGVWIAIGSPASGGFTYTKDHASNPIYNSTFALFSTWYTLDISAIVGQSNRWILASAVLTGSATRTLSYGIRENGYNPTTSWHFSPSMAGGTVSSLNNGFYLSCPTDAEGKIQHVCGSDTVNVALTIIGYV